MAVSKSTKLVVGMAMRGLEKVYESNPIPIYLFLYVYHTLLPPSGYAMRKNRYRSVDNLESGGRERGA